MELQQVFQAREILLNVLSVQGFEVADYKGDALTTINSMVKNQKLDLFCKHTTEDRKLFVKYCNTKPNIPTIVDDFFNGDPAILTKQDNLMLITNEPYVNDSTIKILEAFWANHGYFIVVLPLKVLQYNILEHQLVPKHTALSEEDKQAFLTKLNLTEAQLPEISRFDPVALLLGLRPGTLCHIERNSSTALKEHYYRICI
jgi:DNA-directed RNA polymerase subunit H (RpoH/RPB5)